MGGLDDYIILKVIGKGSYGEVHLIQHKKERKQYVIKKMALQKASKRERKAAELEAKLLSNLKHPNIVSYKDSFENEDGYLYIVMGYAEGGDLYTKLREQREQNEFLSEVQVVRWFIQICMALQYLHQKRILHRDLKTQNIFLTKSKMIKVGDLGIARVLEGASDMATTLIGTPYYMSPELFSNRPYNYKSDVWALGCCAYEMITLKHAFNAKDMNSLVYKILKKKMPRMPDMYSTDLCNLIKSLLHQNADKRPSVSKILRNPFVKKHIQLFLDESSKSRRPSSGRSRHAGSESSSRRTSTSSVQSRGSSRESSVSGFDNPTSAKVEPRPQVSDTKPLKSKSTSPSNQQIFNPSPQPVIGKRGDVSPAIILSPVEKKLANDVAEIDLTSEKQRRSSPNAHKETPPADAEMPLKSPSLPQRKEKSDRAKSAESTASSSSDGSVIRPSRPLRSASKDEHRGSPCSDGDKRDSMKDSSELKSSNSAPEGRVSSARERRREKRKAKEKKETQPKLPETVVDGNSAAPVKRTEKPTLLDAESKRKDSQSGEEINQFYTLLHTTLKLTNQDDSPPLTPPESESATNQVYEVSDSVKGSKLSPVEELSESASSTLTSDKNSQSSPSKITPRATEISVPLPPTAQRPVARGISQATLSSTGRLMDRIVALRKDCIQGLGVPLLHRAYELLDGDGDESALEAKLIDLLGEVRFKQWAGKIWQLKFCEESIFKHCGSITAY